MAQNFEMNTAELEQLFRMSPSAAAKGAKRGLHDSLDDWVKEARDIAPIDKGTLRRGIKAQGIVGRDLELAAKIESVAKERNFNYAFYIHERDAGGKNVNGEKKYLDKSAEQNKGKWQHWIEEEIRKELQQQGW